MLPEDESIRAILEPIIGPWYVSLEDTQKAQGQILTDLLNKYSMTEYGEAHSASHTIGIREYQRNFPVIDYHTLQPYLAQVQTGRYRTFLSEPATEWVMTRGSTGKSKVLPATQTHLKQIFTCGARGLIHFALRTKNFDVFTGNILNLNFPSMVHAMNSEGKVVTYGYSSGTYARLNPMFERVSLLPRQEDIDALGSGIGRADWENRFELAYQQARDKPVTAAMGVTPVILSFAHYMKRKYGKKPCDIWNLQALFCTSVRKIQFKYGPILKHFFGEVPIVEMYTATEGVFGQQYDDLPYITPNYDAYFFEVLTGKGPRMLHELRRGEWGRLIISSCMFPRYDIGDMVESAGNNYFRIFGRRTTLTLLEHRLYRLFVQWII
ncbi:MAG TPA: GH3 auxin-responsive promoter family protein [Candidatus Sulfotelmatobacter sp.]|nr:GH3 auxin-responsive promoter family protein [Candidatus Sulfotelmatobacter sp.]